ncbi:hypothetical protein AZ34_10275 [Hylemonella gracilis str. Niagara R]|uniref:Flagellar hook-length control protein FliK n=1 Tax=Hylemonella gracilis str. Niagara R TaxID=1458275 RepID=A0A016XLY9_9BURK|nr:flagellar hook-length control protein FliK [Hylemonella gracilis]EYC52861.1 hypothetical protein AZ34_10275 [Hylemonella gracilis str. Niagara R]
MATDRISTGSALLPLPRVASTTGSKAGGGDGEMLTLRIESRSGAGANQVFNGRSADGRLFQLSAGLATGINLQIGQLLQVQVPGRQSQFQLAMQGGALLVPSPTQPGAPTSTTLSLAATQVQAQMTDADGEASSRAPDLEQLLLQRFFQGQGSVGDIWVLAQGWRHLVLARMRQVQGPTFAATPTAAARPGNTTVDAAATAASMALLQAMTPDEGLQDNGPHPSFFGATAQAPTPPLLLPQLWMFHTYVWNNTLPLTFWVLPREEEKKEGGQATRQPTRARMLRLCFKHPVHGLLWVDVRVDELHVTLDVHAEQAAAVDALLQLRPAVSAAMAQAGLRLLRFQVRAEPPPRPAHDPDQAGTAALRGGMDTLPAPLNFAESALAPELFLAAVGLMEALRQT